MKQTRLIMGMPITVEIVGDDTTQYIEGVFDYFVTVDERYSTYKPTSEISQINNGLPKDRWSNEMTQVLKLCEETKRQTNGFFDIERAGKLDPSGLVKGWAIHNAAEQLQEKGVHNFYIEAGGDTEVDGVGETGEPWIVGIRSPFDLSQIIKVIRLSDAAIATSGTYIRGEHIYNPHDSYRAANEVASLSIIGPNIYEADRFATAAFAMGGRGIEFISGRPGLEGYMVDNKGIATFTSGFERYVIHA